MRQERRRRVQSRSSARDRRLILRTHDAHMSQRRNAELDNRFERLESSETLVTSQFNEVERATCTGPLPRSALPTRHPNSQPQSRPGNYTSTKLIC